MFCSTVTQRRVGPASRARNEKYGPEGGFNPLNFPELPPSLAATICNTANHSITKGTWSSYRTARKMLDECEAKFAGKNFNFPLSEEASIIFCGWLLERGLQAGTIESYFAGLRAFHLANGFSCVSLRTPLINQIINGRKHQPNSEEKGKRMQMMQNIKLNYIKYYLSLFVHFGVIVSYFFDGICKLSYKRLERLSK